MLTLALIIPVGASAETSDQAAAKAAAEIQAAQDRANKAADAVFHSEEEIDALEVQITQTEKEVTDLEAQVSELQAGVTEAAINRFVDGGVGDNPLFTPVAEATNRNVANTYVGAATGAALAKADDYDGKASELVDAKANLAAQRSQVEAAKASYQKQIETANAEVARLKEVEKQRLADEAVRKAYEKQKAERLAAEERAAAAANSKNAQAAAQNSPQSATTTTVARGPQSAAKTSEAKVASNGETAGDNSEQESKSSEAPSNATPAPNTVPEPLPPPTTAAPKRAGITCPVAGASTFSDTWGAPRSGGRKHLGVDMIAHEGTPLVAAETGSVHFKQTRLGGNSVWVTGKSGTRYFYAHLSRFEGSDRSVSAGEVIGYVGHTGNSPVNHLHFEVHPGGGAAVNPYPYVRAAC